MGLIRRSHIIGWWVCVRRPQRIPRKEDLVIFGLNFASEDCWIAILIVHADVRDPISY